MPVWRPLIKSWPFGLVCEKDVVSWLAVRASIPHREHCGINTNTQTKQHTTISSIPLKNRNSLRLRSQQKKKKRQHCTDPCQACCHQCYSHRLSNQRLRNLTISPTLDLFLRTGNPKRPTVCVCVSAFASESVKVFVTYDNSSLSLSFRLYYLPTIRTLAHSLC